MDKVRVMFVCLGNICRSPMAEGLFIHKVKQAGLEGLFEIDSSGTSGWHVGEPADRRMQEVAHRHGVVLPSRSRKLEKEDLQSFDYILAMDASNLRDIQGLASGQSKADVSMMRDFDPLGKGKDVPDPYYGGAAGFEEVYEMLDRATEGLLAHIQKEKFPSGT